MKTTEKYIEKLEELIVVYNNQYEPFIAEAEITVEDLKEEIAALKANMEQEGHTTCDGCEMFVDNLCMLDVSVCPDCFERSQWTAQKQKKQKPEAKIDLREELINKVNEQKKVSEKQLSDWSFNDMCEHAIEARGQIMAWDYLIEYLTNKT